MKKLLLCITIFYIAACSDHEPVNHAVKHGEDYVKAAHYFSSAWPKTFWQEFEQNDVDGDLKQIKKDGFNTVILVLPWMGFEAEFNDRWTDSNDKMYNRLSFLLSKISQYGLKYMLRVGFPHDFSPNIETTAGVLCQAMYEESPQRKQWLDYLQNIKEVTDDYNSGLIGVLVSWEDFWCPHFVFPVLDANKRQELAQSIGYADWMMKKDPVLLKMMIGKNHVKASDIVIPTKQEMAYFYYLDFIDEKFDESILQSTKSIFPETAMEIRIDKDPAVSVTGEKIWIEHDLYFDEPNHRGTYWAPFWGASNQGEKIPLKDALFNFEYFMNYTTNQGASTNHIVEQFNFTDNTPYFPDAASLNDHEVNDFLIQTVPLFKKYSAGYGVWSYKDYADNALYNASFEFELAGWDHQKAEIVGDEGDRQLRLKNGGYISQTFNPHKRHILARSYEKMTMCLESQSPGRLSVIANDVLIQNMTLSQGENCYELDATEFIKDKVAVKLMAESLLIIDAIKLYGFVQKLGLYDEFNQPGPYIDAIRQVNAGLVK